MENDVFKYETEAPRKKQQHLIGRVSSVLFQWEVCGHPAAKEVTRL